MNKERICYLEKKLKFLYPKLKEIVKEIAEVEEQLIQEYIDTNVKLFTSKGIPEMECVHSISEPSEEIVKIASSLIQKNRVARNNLKVQK